MKKTNLPVPAGEAEMTSPELSTLIEQVRDIIQNARRRAVVNINAIQIVANFEIGRRIVEHEQQGRERAEYGKGIIKALSASLTAEFGSGFSEDNLARMRKFYSVYRERISISAKPSRKSATPFSLSWSHYVLLLTIKNENERNFYEIEAAQSALTASAPPRRKNVFAHRTNTPCPNADERITPTPRRPPRAGVTRSWSPCR